MAKPSGRARVEARSNAAMRKIWQEVLGDPRLQESAICEAMGYLMGAEKFHAAAALALAWPTMFPDCPLPDRMREAMGIPADQDLFGGDYA